MPELIRSTVCYLIQDGQWLMLLRNKKNHDVNHGKWIGVGGKNLAGESFSDCAIRETFEETGLHMDEPIFHGFLYFEYEQQDSEQIAIYTCSRFHGTLTACNEGTLAWIEEDQIMNLNLWQGDRVFLKRLLSHDSDLFCYRMRYDEQGNLIEAEERNAEHE
ncbi:MAG: 8-oxo-dGTP diphosphatase [Solobacterium sp.]|jgi:8-oxo-dGTP diphosphatase|nr:8-oxo-dGTP diphosphatase [Solobacterium sp.]